MCWGTIALVIAVPYFATSWLVGKTAEDVCCHQHYASKAAATVGHWVEHKRVDGWKPDSFIITFRVADKEWYGFSHGEKNEIVRYLAGVIMKEIPDKTFLIRDQSGDCVADGTVNDGHLCDFSRVASLWMSN